MPPSKNPLTLIVATTPIPTPTTTTTTIQNAAAAAAAPTLRLGIGLNGTLPWPRIKTDMSFFARITSRPPASHTTNAILMGRKTYDSIPATLRPLVKRVNTVVTRSVDDVRQRVEGDLQRRREKEEAKKREEEEKEEKKKEGVQGQALGLGQVQSSPGQGQTQGQTDAVVCAGLEEAIETLEATHGKEGRLGQMFVIGGAEIYAAALATQKTRAVRIVMTFVEKLAYEQDRTQVFECDTFFPVDQELLNETNGWKRVSAQEVSEWVGETVTGEWIVDGEVRVKMVGYERTN
ncbi:dihydrofolate reductase [Aspergillus saccharolyticus JOP 1030-1]|uniref:Dihydrofolate reductase n=1 Tax=Aspergillus saccharolyticus JOP 1030-1 TaxID=1450539 RepID=A0A318Z9T9_9EURO|nr:dihydrofolate reductase [Aspergillus saccharolyticus JOP 1030-1]PYH43114.1 dihydrofolate reductase [Aspergillus saccharolyticus JOP 1030-1]